MLFEQLPESLPRPLRASEGGVWDSISFGKYNLLQQGWKIHVSSSIKNASDVLRICAEVAQKFQTDFKYAKSIAMLKSINGKQWSRSGSGKFITFYPHSEKSFLELGQALAEALKTFEGPYILSDRRWPSSKCVSYRYGGFKRLEKTQPDGTRTLHITNPDGEWVLDSRVPFWSVPDYVSNPIQTDNPEENVIHEGPLGSRYIVTEAIAFSSRGGVYLATDTTTDNTVVVKEARPLICVGDAGDDSQMLLSQEYSTLAALKHIPAFVQSIDYFKQGPHSFLIEEYIEGRTLGRYSVLHNPVYSGRLTSLRIRKYLARMIPIWRQLHDVISSAHNAGIVLGDLSLNNVIITEQNILRVIDVEGAFEASDLASNPGIVTPGFFPQGHDIDVTFSRDWYAFGAIMLGTLFVANGIVHLEPATLQRYCSELRRDTDIPEEIFDLIIEIYEKKGRGEWPTRAKEVLDKVEHGLFKRRYQAALVGMRIKSNSDIEERKIQKCINDAIQEIDRTYKDNDLPAWKSDRRAKDKNPYCFAYGISGICYSLLQLGKDSREIFCNRLLDVDFRDLAAGLYVGSAGVSWTALQIGCEEIAKKAFDASLENVINYEDLSLYYGRAGVGYQALCLFRDLGDTYFSEVAKTEARLISEALVPEGSGQLFHESSTGERLIGLAQGGAGIAFFLCELYAVSGNQEYLQTAKRLILSDFTAARWRSGGFIGFPEKISNDGKPMTSPSCYLHSGTSGVVKAAIRYLDFQTDSEVVRKLDRFVVDIERKYTSFPQYEKGLAGVLHTLNIIKDRSDRKGLQKASYEAVRGLVITAIDTEYGVTFPGDQGRETALDFATGAAGIALEMSRFLYGGSRSDLLF